MNNELDTERVDVPRTGTRLAGRADRLAADESPRPARQRWRAFALLVVTRTLARHGYGAHEPGHR